MPMLESGIANEWPIPITQLFHDCCTASDQLFLNPLAHILCGNIAYQRTKKAHKNQL